MTTKNQKIMNQYRLKAIVFVIFVTVTLSACGGGGGGGGGGGSSDGGVSGGGGGLTDNVSGSELYQSYVAAKPAAVSFAGDYSDFYPGSYVTIVMDVDDPVIAAEMSKSTKTISSLTYEIKEFDEYGYNSQFASNPVMESSEGNRYSFYLPSHTPGEYIYHFAINDKSFDIPFRVLLAEAAGENYIYQFVASLKDELDAFAAEINDAELTAVIQEQKTSLDAMVMQYESLTEEEKQQVVLRLSAIQSQLSDVKRAVPAMLAGVTVSQECQQLSKLMVAGVITTVGSATIAYGAASSTAITAGTSAVVAVGAGALTYVSFHALKRVSQAVLDTCVGTVAYQLQEGLAVMAGVVANTAVPVHDGVLQFEHGIARNFQAYAQSGLSSEIVAFVETAKRWLRPEVSARLPASVSRILDMGAERITSTIASPTTGFIANNVSSALVDVAVDSNSGLSIVVTNNGTPTNDAIDFTFDLVSADGVVTKVSAVLGAGDIKPPTVTVNPGESRVLNAKGVTLTGSAVDWKGAALVGDWYVGGVLRKSNSDSYFFQPTVNTPSGTLFDVEYRVMDGLGNSGSAHSTLSAVENCISDGTSDQTCIPGIQLLDEFGYDAFTDYSGVTLVNSVKGWITYVVGTDGTFLYEKFGLPNLTISVDDPDSEKFHVNWSVYMPGRVLQIDGISGVTNGTATSSDKAILTLDVAYEIYGEFGGRLTTDGAWNSYFVDVNDYQGTWYEAYVYGNGNTQREGYARIRLLPPGEFYLGCLLDDVGGYIPAGQSAPYSGPRECAGDI